MQSLAPIAKAVVAVLVPLVGLLVVLGVVDVKTGEGVTQEILLWAAAISAATGGAVYEKANRPRR